MTATANGERRELTALEMALNLKRHVLAYADAAGTEEGQLTAVVNRYGERQHHAAQTAAHLAIVAIAEDVHRLTEAVMSGRFGGPPL
jgi:hypothetical protein